MSDIPMQPGPQTTTPTPAEAPHDVVTTGHTYDDIQEYDNPTPRWWVWLFVITHVWGFGYLLIFLSVGRDLTPEGFYERDQIEALKAQYGQLGDVKPDEPTLIKLMHDPKWNGVGASLYQANCVTCHGNDGSGIAGPNLTDNRYLHVNKIEDIVDIVNNGRRNGAMPSWSERLQPVERVLVSAYVASLRGQNKPSIGGRPAEGNEIAPWPAK